MTRDEESQIREIFRMHLEAATDEIAELDIDCGYYPPGYSGRFAEIMTQSIALMAETSHTTKSYEDITLPDTADGLQRSRRNQSR